VVNVFLSILIGAFSLANLSPNIVAVGFAQGAVVKLYETIDRVPVIDSESDEGLKPDTVEGVIEIEVRYWPV
jgi:ATP-binding cassette subfamily B (MDR/TAP) protein 1